MRNSTKRLTTCAMMCALSVVLMLLGTILELGMYASPLLAGLCLIPIGQAYGRKYQWIVYVATSVLCLILVPLMEENLMYIGLFGWYPILRSSFQKLPKFLCLVAKLIAFNIAVIAIESLVLFLIAPEDTGGWLLVLLLILGNITFLFYDFAFAKIEILTKKISLKL